MRRTERLAALTAMMITLGAGAAASDPGVLCATEDALHLSAGGLRTVAADGSAGPSTGARLPAVAATCGAETVFLAARDGLYAVTPDGHRRWSRTDLGRIAPVRLAGGVVHVAGHDGRVSAVDAVSGETRWQHQSEGWLLTPALTRESVVVGGRSRTLTALDRRDGSVRWRVPTDQQLARAPLVRDGFVLVASYGPTVTAFDAHSGERRWRRRLPGAPSLLASLGEDVVVGTFDGALLRIDPADGSVRWQQSLAGRADRPPLVTASRIHQPLRLGRDGGALLTLDPDTGTPLCRTPLPGRPAGRPVQAPAGLLVPLHADIDHPALHVLDVPAAGCRRDSSLSSAARFEEAEGDRS